MHDHNLDDLIIDEQTSNNSKAKGILTILALVIVVLIVAIVLTKVILKDPKVDAVVIDDSAKMLSPDLKLQDDIKEDKTDTDEEIVTDEQKDEFDLDEEVIAKPKTEETTTEKVVVKPPVESIKKPIAKPVVKPHKPIHHTDTTVHKKPRVKQVKITDEFEQIKTKPSKPKVVHSSHVTKSKVNVSEKYYIQVGSFTQTPSQSFLGIIKRSGFNYTITKPTANGTKKLLIGPYPSRQAVDKALQKVRDRINKGAFVYKVK